MINWIDVKNNRPAYGEPVLLVANGVIQHVTYMLGGADESSDWFEPYHFDHDDNMKMKWYQADSWCYIDAL